jgi:hypothetical protein
MTMQCIRCSKRSTQPLQEGQQFTQCDKCGMWNKMSATERLAEGVERYIGTPRQLMTLFWVYALGPVFVVAVGLLVAAYVTRS